jgi:hypothetical protein
MAEPLPQEAPPDSRPDTPGQMGGPRTGMDPGEMHEHAVEASKHVEALATGFAKGDAEPDVIKAVTDMAEMLRGIAKAMAKAPTPAPTDAPPHETMATATDALAQSARRR